MDFLVKHYEKIILGVFLVGMLGWCWYLLQTMTTAHQHIYNLRIQMETDPGSRKPLPALKHNDFTGLQSLADPRAEWIPKGDLNYGTLADPPRYIRCRNAECFYLLPYNIKICPYCKTDQGPVPQTPGQNLGNLDSDGDGMPDAFEKKHASFLDANDPNDATRDEDNDKFTNFEEYVAGTRSDDPGSHPPMAGKLRFLRTVQSPLPIMFSILTRNPKVESDRWIMQFTITKDNRKISRFARVGENIDDYTVLSLVPKTEDETDPATKSIVSKDISEVTIKRDNEDPITLVRGKPSFEKGTRTELIFLTDVYNSRNCPRYDLRINDQFQLPAGPGKSETYLLKEVVGEEAVVVLVGSDPPQEFKVMKWQRSDFRRTRAAASQEMQGSIPGAFGLGMPGMPAMPQGMPGGVPMMPPMPAVRR